MAKRKAAVDTRELSSSEKVSASLARIEKQFGKGSVMRLGNSPHIDIDVIPTGIMSVDIATGIGGIPRGRIVEFFGKESAGKTMLSLYVVAEAQAMGLDVAFVDAEHALNTELAPKLGVDIDKLIVSQPDSGEQGLAITDELVSGGGMGLVVVDSVAALTPRAEIEGDIGDAHIGLQARLMSQALRKLTGPANLNGTAIIFINQLRMKVNTGPYGGNPETTPGGRALPFYASMRLDIRPIGQKKDGDTVIGRRTRIKVVKNKLSAPFKQAEIDLLFDGDTVGFDKSGDMLELAISLGIAEQSGSWYKYNSEGLGQGADNAKVSLMGHEKEVRKEILTRISTG